MVLLQRKLSFSKYSEGIQYFPGGGVQLFPREVQMLISIETHITCDFLVIFQGRSGSPILPLDPHMIAMVSNTQTAHMMSIKLRKLGIKSLTIIETC